LSEPPVEVWRGGVNAWDCDGMGHLNVRYYVAYAMEGLAGLAAELGLADSFRPGAPSTVVVRDHHLRYLREARESTVLHMRAGVLEMGETDARLLFVLYHSMTGEVCAAIQAKVAHVTAADLRPFPWSPKVREKAARLMTDLPHFAAARSLSQDPPSEAVSLARADELALEPIGRGLVQAGDCDIFGRMSAHQFLGHVADGITGMVTPFRQTVVDHAETKPDRFGGAALEYRIAYRAWPRIGDRFVVRSGLSAVDGVALRMTHWILDPATGAPWGGAEAVVTTFDLDRRKIVRIGEGAQAVIRGWLRPDLTL
jgi:acyl-CoA thioester hydrolase